MNPSKLNTAIGIVQADPDIPEPLRQKLNSVLQEAREPLPDTMIYRIVVLSLGSVALATVFGGIVLAILNRTTENLKLSEGIIAIASTSVGALAGLLIPPPRN